MMLSAFVLAAVAHAVEPASQLPQGWAGLSTCEGCHQEQVNAYLTGAHGRAMLTGGTWREALCEQCHGAAAAHAEDPEAVRPPRLAGETATAACTSCHAAALAGLERATPGHVRGGVGCLSCHDSGHAPEAEPEKLRQEPLGLCGSCHPQQRARFSLPFAHRQGSSPMPCTGCHQLHQARPQAPWLGKAQSACVSCHSEKRGPYVFPHPPEEVRGCGHCHQPHGSPNPQALTRAETSWLCLECHADTPGFHDLSQPQYRQCTACHRAVHGSQRSPRLFQE